MTNIELFFRKILGTAKMDATRLVGVHIETVDRCYKPVASEEDSAVLCWLQMSKRLSTVKRDLGVTEYPFFTEYPHRIPEGRGGETIGDFLCGIGKPASKMEYVQKQYSPIDIDYKVKK